MDILDIAKSFCKSGHNFGLDRSHFEAEIHKRAAATRLPGETREQGFVRISTETEAGRTLFKAAVFGPAPVQAAQDFPARRPQPAGDASKELEELARDMARRKNMSFERAYSQLYTDPERKALVERIKREEADATRRVRAQRFPMPAYQGEDGTF